MKDKTDIELLRLVFGVWMAGFIGGLLLGAHLL